MHGNELAPFKRAKLDQWNAKLADLVTSTAAHVHDECVKPAGVCLGPKTEQRIRELTPIAAMSLLELAVIRLAGNGFVYEPHFHCWVPNRPGEDPDDHEHDTSIDCDWGWICNGDGCEFRTDLGPCPEHAPVEVPMLRLTECQAEPRHWLWAHRNDDYGHGCPSCWVDQLNAKLSPLLVAAGLREHRWCWATNRVKRALVWLRLMRVHSWSSGCRNGSHVSARWRWTRR